MAEGVKKPTPRKAPLSRDLALMKSRVNTALNRIPGLAERLALPASPVGVYGTSLNTVPVPFSPPADVVPYSAPFLVTRRESGRNPSAPPKE